MSFAIVNCHIHVTYIYLTLRNHLELFNFFVHILFLLFFFCCFFRWNSHSFAGFQLIHCHYICKCRRTRSTVVCAHLNCVPKFDKIRYSYSEDMRLMQWKWMCLYEFRSCAIDSAMKCVIPDFVVLSIPEKCSSNAYKIREIVKERRSVPMVGLRRGRVHNS